MLKTIYLCGPIAGCSDSEAHNWRDWVKEQTRGWAECLDPMRRDYRGKGLADENDRMPDSIVKEIVELDKVDIVNANILLANMLPDKSKTGSNMEIIYAWGLGKLVIIVLPKNLPISPWHRYHAQKIFHTLDDAIEYIRHGNWNNV
jgi:hypothetical protein